MTAQPSPTNNQPQPNIIEPEQSQDELESYPFLRVIKEKDAVALGLNPSNTYQHVILKKIRDLSTIQSAMKGMLFQISNSILDALKIGEENAISSLNRLILNQLVLQVVCLDYDLSAKKLGTLSFFIANPPEVTRKSIVHLYEELLRYSFNSIRLWYESRDSLETSLFLSDLEQNHKRKSKKQYHGIINLYKELKNLNHNVIVSDELVNFTAKYLSDRLINENMAVQISGHGLLILREDEILPYFETTVKYFEEEVLPPIKVDPIIKYKLEKISLEEKSYYNLERFPVDTAKFVVKKANEIKNSFIQKAEPGSKSEVPASLAIETLISLEPLVEKKYIEAWKEECNQNKKQFKDVLTDPSVNWSKLIKFITQEESLNYPPEVWKDLILDKELFYMVWEHRSNSMHIFTSKEEAMLNTIIHGVLNLPPKEQWKATAIQSLIEEKQLQLKALFKDKKFVQSFHKLVKKVYTEYLPWYKRILTVIPFLEEYFFDTARKQIKDEQKLLAKKNQEIIRELNLKIDKEKLEKLTRLKDTLLLDSLIETLDVFYFTKHSVPLVKEIKDFYPDYDLKSFVQILNEQKFKIIMPDEKNQPETGILLYPEEHSAWKDRKVKLKKNMSKLLDGYQNSYKYTPDKSLVDRIKKLLAFLEKR